MTADAPDQRERDRVAGELDRTLFVEAGAGTGKTTALVARIRTLVAGGAEELRHIAAITFTEAAAAQLRDRVRTSLEAAAADAVLTEDERRRCAAAVFQVDEAAMLTLHGFAQQLLAEHPLEAGLPPFFEVLDDLAEAESFDQVWRTLLDDVLDDPALTEPVETLFALGLTLFGLEGVARGLAADYDRLAAPGAIAAPHHGEVDIDGWCESLAAVLGCLGWCRSADGLAAHLEALRTLHERLAAAPRREQLRLLCAAKVRTNAGQAANWDGRADEVRGRLRELDERREALVALACEQALAPLLARLRAWALDYAVQRRREGRVNFHDLLVLARDLLRDRPDVRRTAGRRWRRLLIDEFQDTDPLQVEIARSLAGDGGEPEPGRLFFVGDPKQSIYRFRRADIGVYRDARDAHADGLVRLSASFRTVPGVVAAVNAVFADLLDGSPGQAPFHALEAVRDPLPDAAAGMPPVRLLGGPDPAGEAGTLRAREAGDVARAIRAIREQGWPVTGERGEGTRAARYADIAILLPTRTGLADLERALDRADVPYRVEASSLVYGTQEVRELIALLRAVDDPTDEVAIVAALRGPGLACPDDALAAWAEAGRRWDYRHAPAADTDDLVAQGLSELARFHSLRRRLDPAALLDTMVRELRLFPLALGRSRARDAWRRLRFLLDETRTFAEGGGTLRELIRRLERQADDRVRVTEQVLPDEDDDAVRILTVHAAKGLEFPVAILAGLGVRAQAGGGLPLAWDAGGIAQVRCGTVQTAGYDAAKRRDTALDEQERARLLYVAATRARDYLIIGLHHRPAKTGVPTSAELLHARLAERADLAACWDPPALDRAPAAPPAHRADPVDPAAWRAARDRAMAGWRAAPIVSATALAAGLAPADGDAGGDAGTQPDHHDDDDAPPRPPFRRGRAGTALGRAVHAALQTVALDGSDEVDAVAAAQAAAEGVGDRADEVGRMVQAALASAPVREAVASGRWWREVPVAAAIGEGMLEGFVDLLYQDADGRLVLVDYKTDRTPDEAPARYRVQMGAYAFAVAQALGRPVDRAGLVFAASATAAVHWVEDLEAAVGEARDAATARFAAPAR
jgi:ATP-dependent helicase/nuclease subunit A